MFLIPRGEMMKKVALSLAGVLAAAAFAPEASALPVFARQTGMACNACHFQHFPLLNGFGRSFKSSAFTLMGAQGKVEGEGLSIPAELNFAGLTSLGYEKNNALTTPVGTGVRTPANGSVFVPGTNGEMSLFFGGRVSDDAGFLSEFGMLGVGGASALGSAKLPILYEVAPGTRAGLVFFTTAAQGASYGFETLNTGANAIHVQSNTPGFAGQYAGALSAQQYIGTGGFATGASLVVNNAMGFINLTKWHQVGPNDLAGTGASLGSSYARIAGTFDLGGADVGVGIQHWGGRSTTALLVLEDTKATAVDGQIQSAVGEMPLGVYASYAFAGTSAPQTGVANVFNAGTLTRSSLNINAELGVVPEKATVGAGYRRANSGVAKAGTVNSNTRDDALFLTATYKLAQNMLARLSYVHQYGTYWNQPAGLNALGGLASNAQALGNNSYTINLYTLF
jgi:hypothetical protein